MTTRPMSTKIKGKRPSVPSLLVLNFGAVRSTTGSHDGFRLSLPFFFPMRLFFPSEHSDVDRRFDVGVLPSLRRKYEVKDGDLPWSDDDVHLICTRRTVDLVNEETTKKLTTKYNFSWSQGGPKMTYLQVSSNPKYDKHRSVVNGRRSIVKTPLYGNLSFKCYKTS